MHGKFISSTFNFIFFLKKKHFLKKKKKHLQPVYLKNAFEF